MKLHLSKQWHLGSDYSNDEGQVIYRVRTDSRLHPTLTQISRRMQGSLSSWASSTTDEDDCLKSPDRDEEAADITGSYASFEFDNRFAHFARIDWAAYKPSIITIGGTEVDSATLFRKGEWNWIAKDRHFNGPDGRAYKWIVHNRKLLLDDGTDALVARYHVKPLNFLNHKPEETYVEITRFGEHIIDFIFVTFLYIEKLREDN